jgi:hypothetical protein
MPDPELEKEWEEVYAPHFPANRALFKDPSSLGLTKEQIQHLKGLNPEELQEALLDSNIRVGAVWSIRIP